jgi:WXG100 family type VII secretion target
MSFFVFIRALVEQAIRTITGEQQRTNALLEALKAVAARVPQAWIGDDATEFTNDFQRRIVPGLTNLFSAIGQINTNLNRGTQIVDTADRNCRGMASRLGDVFNAIF